jgi:hypothetical protein
MSTPTTSGIVKLDRLLLEPLRQITADLRLLSAFCRRFGARAVRHY